MMTEGLLSHGAMTKLRAGPPPDPKPGSSWGAVLRRRDFMGEKWKCTTIPAKPTQTPCSVGCATTPRVPGIIGKNKIGGLDENVVPSDRPLQIKMEDGLGRGAGLPRPTHVH